ncbi:SLC13 family permease [Roseomonas stagni]|uniref:SLC13 family permease n=1 Tax=Falsiroseomonas algicola TaxID=2716930 RepID=A0A6M1LPE4_9PROT|nr:SLC13 family permease [Falsiroseomonas algicola]NGM22023.1 SLC13 family permease [Falsiroseomonas algicola]
MSRDQVLITGLLLATLVMFAWGRWRHDMVAMGALLAAVALGLVPGEAAFAGFGHAAVITVACVLVLSSGLQSSGAVDALARVMLPRGGRPVVSVAAITALAAVLSAFMNNVGALALLMPIAIQLAAREGLPPGQVLMPLAFGSILGGMTTLIGTPPNLIVAGFRAEAGGERFAMFDFAPVGVAVALAGVAFVVVAARWLVPARERRGAEAFDIGSYMTEARVAEDSAAAGMTLREIEAALDSADAQVVGLIRHEVRIPAPPPQHRVEAGDILVIEARPEGLAATLSTLGLALEEDVPVATDGAATPAEEETPAAAADDDLALTEYAVMPAAAIVGRSATDIRLRDRYAVNLLAISRQGTQRITRLRTERVRPGDVLMLQGAPEALAEFATQFGCVPLASRTLRLPAARQAWAAAGVMLGAIGLAASGLASSAVAFAGGVLAAMALRVVSPRGIYAAVDWTVVVLLAALIPVAGAMETTGAAEVLARFILDQVDGQAVIALVVILVATMTLSDVINNAATAAVMCPIAVQTAGQLSVSADAFLMAVAIGASCAFLTPIGHQNNTLILGPGGFRFGDYWRLGLPLEVIVVAVAVPMLLVFWPL